MKNIQILHDVAAPMPLHHPDGSVQSAHHGEQHQEADNQLQLQQHQKLLPK